VCVTISIPHAPPHLLPSLHMLQCIITDESSCHQPNHSTNAIGLVALLRERRESTAPATSLQMPGVAGVAAPLAAAADQGIPWRQPEPRDLLRHAADVCCCCCSPPPPSDAPSAVAAADQGLPWHPESRDLLHHAADVSSCCCCCPLFVLPLLLLLLQTKGFSCGTQSPVTFFTMPLMSAVAAAAVPYLCCPFCCCCCRPRASVAAPRAP
jgi:hypothetical protein